MILTFAVVFLSPLFLPLPIPISLLFFHPFTLSLNFTPTSYNPPSVAEFDTSNVTLHWGRGNLSAPVHVFEHGISSRDHIISFSPLCLETDPHHPYQYRTLFHNDSTVACSTLHETDCSKSYFLSRVLPDLHIPPSTSSETITSLSSSSSSSAVWVDGLTVLQAWRFSGANVAHFSDEVLHLHHVLQHISLYAPHSLANITDNGNSRVIALPAEKLIPQFSDPARRQRFHQALLAATVHPREITNAPSLYSAATMPLGSVAVVTGNDTDESSPRFTCFRRAIVPGYMKGRFFMSDFEYPSTSTSTSISTKSSTPADLLSLSRLIELSATPPLNISAGSTGIVLLHRAHGKRRLFDSNSLHLLHSELSRQAARKRLPFDVVDFSGMSFSAQVSAVSRSRLAVGLHGANLVNAMHLPPGAALLELFPYGFMHDMYAGAGNAGVRYDSYTFERPGVPKCENKDAKVCRLYYRDATIKASKSDIRAIGYKLRALLDAHAE